MGDDADLWYYQNGYMYPYDDGSDRKTDFADMLRKKGKKKYSYSSFSDYDRNNNNDDGFFSNVYGLPL